MQNSITNATFYENTCEQNTINLLYSHVNIETVTFRDNLANGGSNVINSIASDITMKDVQSVQTFLEESEDVTRDAGFIMLTYGSTLDMDDCLVAHTQGGMAAAIFAIGHSKIKIHDSQFYDN